MIKPVRITRVRSAIAVCATVACLAVAEDARAQTLEDNALNLEQLLPDGTFNQPTTIAFLAPNDFLVLEKATGEVHRVLNGTTSGTPVLTVPVNSASERGLLGIAINSQVPRAGVPVLHRGAGAERYADRESRLPLHLERVRARLADDDLSIFPSSTARTTTAACCCSARPASSPA